MRWVGRTGAAVLVGALVVLTPLASAPATAAQGYKPPVTPYADLPSQQTKLYSSEYVDWLFDKYGYEAVQEFDTDWPTGSAGQQAKTQKVKEFLGEKGYAAPSDVSADRVATAQKNGTTTAKVSKPVTKPGALIRGAGGALVVADGFLAGFAIGDAGLALYGQITGENPLQAACGTDLESAVGFIYAFSGPSCWLDVENPNPDAESVEPGWTAAPFTATGAGSMGSWGSWSSASMRIGVVEAQAFASRYPGLTISGVSGYTGTTAANTSYIPSLSVPIRIEAKVTATGVWESRLSSVFNVATQGGGFKVGSFWTPQGISDEASYAPSSAMPSKYSGWRLSMIGLDGQVVAYWYPEGAPDRPEGMSGDPEREISCGMTWPDGTTTELAGESYLESVGFPIYSAGQACNEAAKSAGKDGQLPTLVEVKSKNRETGKTDTILKQQTPEYTPEEQQSLNDKTGKGLVLLKGAQSCLRWEADCSGWWEATEHGKKLDTDYSCTYGGAAVALAQCVVYSQTFEDQTGTSTPVVNDPLTGEKVEWVPDSGDQNSTSPGSGLSPGDQCFAEWSSAPNPVEWVLHPVKCALVWAFVPRTSVVTATQQQIASAWEPTIFGQLPGVVGAALTIPDGGTGCSGPHVVIPLKLPAFGLDSGYDGYPLSACEEPMSVLATWARLIGAAVLIWLTGLGIIRRASATVNAPGVGAGAG